MTLVMTAGGFDPLHPGHLSLFRKARALGDRLVVVVESDEWLAARKHPPLLTQWQRIQLVGELRSVDDVLAGSGESCGHLIRERMPDIFVVGKDHEDTTTVPEADACKRLGTRIVVIDSGDDTHSSNLVSSVVKSFHSRNMPVAVSAIIETDDGVMLGCREGDPTAGQYALIGGFVDNGESLEEALRREIREETSLEIVSAEYFCSLVGKYHDGRNILSPYFICKVSGVPTQSAELSRFHYVTTPVETAFESDTEALALYFARRNRADA